jgi:hypothetical protein
VRSRESRLIIPWNRPSSFTTGSGTRSSGRGSGIIEGIADATASFTKMLSSYIADKLGYRKLLVIAGYLLTPLGQVMIALVKNPGHSPKSRADIPEYGIIQEHAGPSV